jgi:hypothetical protein
MGRSTGGRKEARRGLGAGLGWARNRPRKLPGAGGVTKRPFVTILAFAGTDVGGIPRSAWRGAAGATDRKERGEMAELHCN